METLSGVTTTLDLGKIHASTSKDQLSILGKKNTSIDAGLAVSSAAQLELTKTRNPIKPTDLDGWRKASLEDLEEVTLEPKVQERCCALDCEADYWQKAWKAQKDRADAQEKSATEFKQSLEQSQTNVKSEKEKISKTEQRVTRLLKRLKEVNSRVKNFEEDKQKLELERDQARQEREDIKEAENNQAVLVSRLQTQVAEYKRLVATYTAEGSQFPDDQLRSSFNNIFNRIRNIAVKLTRGAGFEYSSLPHQTKSQIVAFIPNGQDIAKASWIDTVISIISQHLVGLADPHNCFGWSDDEPVKSAIYLARSMAANDERVSRQWVEATRELLMATCTTDLRASESTLIDDTVSQVRNTLTCATPWTEATNNDVRSVFTLAYGFFRLLRSQRSTYQVRMLPILHGGECLTFDAEVMEETITSQHEVDGQAIEVSAFPGLYKLDEEMNECIIACPKVKVRQKPTFGERVKASLSEGSATSVFRSIFTGEDL